MAHEEDIAHEENNDAGRRLAFEMHDLADLSGGVPVWPEITDGPSPEEKSPPLRMNDIQEKNSKKEEDENETKRVLTFSKPRRSDALVDKERVLLALGECRRVLIEGRTDSKAGGPLYHSISAVMATIDGLALLLTSDRAYFRLQAHGETKGAPDRDGQG